MSRAAIGRRFLSLVVTVTLARTTLAQTSKPSPTTLPDVANARPGEIARVAIDSLDAIARLPITIAPVPGPPLVFSDGPEYFPGDGIALREDVPRGLVRLMLYHCPEATGRPSTISCVIANRGDRPMTLRVTRHAAPTPGLDYLRIGRSGLVDFLSRRAGPADRIVAPGERVVLDPTLDRTVVKKDELVHLFDELDCSEPSQITVFQRRPTADSLTVIDTLPTIATARDGAGRGTFAHADYEVTTTDDSPIDTAGGPRQLVVADGKSDPWTRGHDALGDVASINKGNYGVMYRIRLTLRSGDGRRMAMLLAKPQDDAGYCPATTAAVALREGDDAWSLGESHVVALPTTGTLRRFPQAAMIGVIAPARGAQRTIELTYSPPAASCLPTPIILMPID